MMKHRDFKNIYIGWLALIALVGVRPCLALDQESAGDSAPKAEKKASERDPVTEAFAIPYGTLLSEKQRTEYDRLKEAKEPALREAYDALGTATTWKDKSEIRSKISALEHEIRAAVRKIAKMATPDATQNQPPSSNMPQGYNSYGQAMYGNYYASGSAGYGCDPGYGYPGYGDWYGGYYWPWRYRGANGNRNVGYPVGYNVGYPVGTTVGYNVGQNSSNHGPSGTTNKSATASKPTATQTRSQAHAAAKHH